MMNILKTLVFFLAAASCANPALAAVNLGALSGSRIETFSFQPGQVDETYNFSLTGPASFSVVQTDFAFGGALSSSLSLRSAEADPNPPSDNPTTLLSISIRAIAGIDAELAAERQRLTADLQSGDAASAEIERLEISQTTARRAQLLALIDQLLQSPNGLPQLLRMAGPSTEGLEGVGQLSDTLAAGSYSLRLSGAATGPGGGYLTFAATPAIANAVPEPAAWALMMAGFGLVGAALRRRKGPAVGFAAALGRARRLDVSGHFSGSYPNEERGRFGAPPSVFNHQRGRFFGVLL